MLFGLEDLTAQMYMDEGGEGGASGSGGGDNKPSGNNSTPDNMSGGSSTPVQSQNVDGGNADDVNKSIEEMQNKLQNSQDSYKGLQRNYNQLFEQAQQKDQQIEQLQSSLAELKEQVNSVETEKEQTSEQLNEINSAVDEAKQQATRAEREASMYRMIATKYPELGGISETLDPKESDEATEEMLEGMSKIVNQAVDAQLKRQTSEYNGSGSVPRDGGNNLSMEALRSQMGEAAGTDEYQKYADQYYALVQQKGEFPRPKSDEFDEMLLAQ